MPSAPVQQQAPAQQPARVPARPLGPVEAEVVPAEAPMGGLERSGEDPVAAMVARFQQREQQVLDRLTPHAMERWLAFVGCLCIFLVRMFYIHGFYIVTYVLFIFLLNQFILFLQPKDRTNLGADGPSLPTTDSDDYRPFYRMLPEFKFWYTAMRATIISFICTFIPIFDIPVFWPVLVMYFVVLFFATMRRQIMDMKRFKYVPWDIGKPKANPKVVSNPPQDAASAASSASGHGGRKKVAE